LIERISRVSGKFLPGTSSWTYKKNALVCNARKCRSHCICDQLRHSKTGSENNVSRIGTPDFIYPESLVKLTDLIGKRDEKCNSGYFVRWCLVHNTGFARLSAL
jgi:hypothetical protein